MNSIQVSKTQFSTAFAGAALLQPVQRVTFSFSGTITGGSRQLTQVVPVMSGLKYVSDASYRVSGTLSTDNFLWKKAPRVIYLTPESSTPMPRVYLFKSNLAGEVQIIAYITNITTSNFTLTGSYTFSIDVSIFGSNLTY